MLLCGVVVVGVRAMATPLAPEKNVKHVEMEEVESSKIKMTTHIFKIMYANPS